MHFFLALIVALWLIPMPVNCAQTTPAEREFERWLNLELLPFLSNRFGKHPRLKGLPFRVVTAKDNSISGKIDGLSLYIRQKIVDRLQSTPGAHLVFSLPVKRWKTRTSFPDVDCRLNNNVTIQVIVEVDEKWVTGETRVAVQAFDQADNTWVKGFKKVWLGTLSSREKQLLDRQVIDNNLLGSRGVPFRSNQPDLVASFLAENLSCLLKNTGQSTLKLSMPKTPSKRPGFVQTVFELLHHYLNRFREIKFTKREFANVTVTSRFHEIEPKLYQISVGLHSIDDSIRIFGASTEAYVRFEKPPSPRRQPSVGKRIVKAPLIDTFELIGPSQQSLCKTTAQVPRNRHVRLTETSQLPSNGCFALRLKTAESANLYLLAQTDNGAVTRLFPDSCNSLGLRNSFPSNRILKHQTLYAPLTDTGKKVFFRLDRQPGIENVYAVVVVDAKIETKLKQRIQSWGDLCVKGHTAAAFSRHFRHFLNELASESDGSLEWLHRSFVHIP